MTKTKLSNALRWWAERDTPMDANLRAVLREAAEALKPRPCCRDCRYFNGNQVQYGDDNKRRWRVGTYCDSCDLYKQTHQPGAMEHPTPSTPQCRHFQPKETP